MQYAAPVIAYIIHHQSFSEIEADVHAPLADQNKAVTVIDAPFAI
jgi:hypothetical protein